MGFLFEFDDSGNPAGHSTTDSADYSELTFERIKHVNEYGQEFWYARELQIALEYKQWRRFAEAIDRAKAACQNSGNEVAEHFADVGKSSPMPNGGFREIEDIELSRYACYLIVQNGDPRKEVIALGQTYFAIKTRQQELIENYDNLSDDQKRLAIRQEMREHNKSLADAAHDAGVEMFLVPKTPKSKRCIAIPDFLYDEVHEYLESLYESSPDDRIFYFTKCALEKKIKSKATAAGLPAIRVHDLRNSHASLLIELGYDILEIAERLGHESAKTTWDTYSHLYPDKDKKLAADLNKLRCGE